MVEFLTFIIVCAVYFSSVKIAVILYDKWYDLATQEDLFRFSRNVCFFPLMNSVFVISLLLMYIYFHTFHLFFLWLGKSKMRR